MVMDIKNKSDKDNALEKVKEYWDSRDSKFKKNAILSSVVLVVALGGFIYLHNKSSYEFLLNTSDTIVSSNVLSQLREKGIDYEVRGQSIYVSNVNTDELKLELSGEGILSSSNSTIDFTEATFYSESQQKTLIKKDLENTLKNTIKNYNEIKDASVIITLGEQSAFKNDNTPSKAAIQLNLASHLSAKQIKSIQALVAAAVPNLSEENVVVTDSNNNLLSSNASNEFDSESNETYKLSLETKISDSIRELLSVAFPGQNYKVVTTMDINFDQTKIEKESVQSGPDTIISQTTTSETTRHETSSGQVGTESNVPDYETPDNKGNIISDKKSETINYELNKVKEQITKSPEIKRLSVSVIVDKALSNEEKQVISELISTAALVDLNRGDVVSVAGVNATAVEENSNSTFMDKFGGLINTGIDKLPMILLAIFIMISGSRLISLFLNSKKEEIEDVIEVDSGNEDNNTPETLEDDGSRMTVSNIDLTPQQAKVREFVKTEMEENPQKVASVLQMIKDGKL